MKRTSRPRKARPAVKRRTTTFTIVLDAQKIAVEYEPHWMEDIGHFQFRSPRKPSRPISISETGYRSYYAPMEEVEAAASPQDFALEAARAILRSRRRPRDVAGEASGQLSLF
jgi:hypothetical protein